MKQEREKLEEKHQKLQVIFGMRHGAENVWHGAKNVWHGAENMQHGAKNVRHGAFGAQITK